MTTCLGKSCSFGLARVPFVNCCQFMYLVVSLLVLSIYEFSCFPFGFEGRMWDLIVSVPDQLSFYFAFFFETFSPTYTDNLSMRLIACFMTQ